QIKPIIDEITARQNIVITVPAFDFSTVNSQINQYAKLIKKVKLDYVRLNFMKGPNNVESNTLNYPIEQMEILVGDGNILPTTDTTTGLPLDPTQLAVELAKVRSQMVTVASFPKIDAGAVLPDDQRIYIISDDVKKQLSDIIRQLQFQFVISIKLNANIMEMARIPQGKMGLMLGSQIYFVTCPMGYFADENEEMSCD
ncbi:MAG: hypothetical protein ABIH03_10330, partial [Pseudomonadota bacterium]